MSDLLNTVTRGWNIIRLIRVIFGLIALIYALQSHDSMLAFAGAVLFFMGVFNMGCAGRACAVPGTKKPAAKTEEIEFEEIS